MKIFVDNYVKEDSEENIHGNIPVMVLCYLEKVSEEKFCICSLQNVYTICCNRSGRRGKRLKWNNELQNIIKNYLSSFLDY